MKAVQSRSARILKTAHWPSMYEPDAPAILLTQISWLQLDTRSEQEFFPGEDSVWLCIGLSGNGTIETGGQKTVLSRGSAFLANADDSCRIRTAVDDFRFILLRMRGHFIRSILEHLLQDRGHVFPVGPDTNALCEEIYTLASAGWNYEREIRISCLLYDLSGLLLLSNASDEVLAPSVSYMQSHYSEPLTTKQLAALCYLGTSQYIKRFNTAYGMPPKRFLNSLRVSHAKALLQETALPVAVIAQKVGFEDASYFTRLYKKLTGETPRAYRTGGL